MLGRAQRLMGEALRWRAICLDSTNRFLEGRWRFVFMRAFAMNASFLGLRSCEARLHGTLWRRRSILLSNRQAPRSVRVEDRLIRRLHSETCAALNGARRPARTRPPPLTYAVGYGLSSLDGTRLVWCPLRFF